MSEAKIYSLKFLFDPTQITLEELKEKTERVLSDYLPNKIEFNVDGANPAFWQLEVKGSLELIDECHKKLNKKLIKQSQLKFVRVVDEAGDEIRRQAYPILADIEQRFRVFINRALTEVIGFDWWDTLAPSDISSNVQSKLDKHQNDGTLLHPMECTEFSHLITLITAEVSQWSETKLLPLKEVKDLLLNSDTIDSLKSKFEEKVKKFCYWDVFAPYFRDQNQWEEIKKSINIVISERHKVMHHRPIRYGVLKILSEKKIQLFELFDSAKSALSEQEREEARKFINNYSSSLNNSLENLSKILSGLSVLDTIKAQTGFSQQLAQSISGLSAIETLKIPTGFSQQLAQSISGLSAIETLKIPTGFSQQLAQSISGLSAIETLKGQMSSAQALGKTIRGF